MLKKTEDTESDTAEQSALRLRTQQKASDALVVTDQRTANGEIKAGQLSPVKLPNQNMVRKPFIFNFGN